MAKRYYPTAELHAPPCRVQHQLHAFFLVRSFFMAAAYNKGRMAIQKLCEDEEKRSTSSVDLVAAACFCWQYPAFAQPCNVMFRQTTINMSWVAQILALGHTVLKLRNSF